MTIQPGMIVHDFNPSTVCRRQRKAHFYEFKVSLVYRVNFMMARKTKHKAKPNKTSKAEL